MNEVCIVSAKRTPFGRFLGSLSRLSAVDLACHSGEAALSGLDRSKIDQVIIGNILSAGQGMNIARQVGVKLDLPVTSPAFTVNMMCASGMQAIALAAQAIRAGESSVVLCGGTESMSNAPHLLPRSRSGIKLGDGKLVDSILRDGLVDSFDHTHMAMTAEALASEYAISREEQDAFAAASQSRYQSAQKSEVFVDEVSPLEALADDEHPRADTTVDSLAGLKPAFDPEGSVTAGNASGLNDGSAMLLLCSREAAKANDWPVLAVITGTASVGCDPRRMGLGPVFAIRKLLEQSGRALESFDGIEINEAFAVQVLACLRDLQLDSDRINSHGGAIALGHPIGASGARIVTHLAHQIHRRKIDSGLASLCVGGGMGSAIKLDRPS
ncbi:MAG: acetyl-CoA C-acyltransferase [Verrucomicrobiales bacterium]|nr:acetyl-CoA C-acyltransferase [Verrucomicrobiales bacterium]